MREESQFHDFKLVFMPGDESDESFLLLKKHLPFDHKHLAKIAPALPATFRIGVWRGNSEDGLWIWGFVPSSRGWPLYIEAGAGEIVLTLPSDLTAVLTSKVGAKIIDPKKVSFVRERSRQVRHDEARKARGTANLKEADLKEIARGMPLILAPDKCRAVGVESQG